MACGTLTVTVSFRCHPDTTGHLGRENYDRRTASIRLACGQVCGALPLLLIDVAGSGPL